ncbi:MAG: hypothetical protein QXU01_01500 [Candidatus Hadarchaeales archaeon]
MLPVPAPATRDEIIRMFGFDFANAPNSQPIPQTSEPTKEVFVYPNLLISFQLIGVKIAKLVKKTANGSDD